MNENFYYLTIRSSLNFEIDLIGLLNLYLTIRHGSQSNDEQQELITIIRINNTYSNFVKIFT